MGKKWDGDRGGRDQWVEWMAGIAREALRVAKPGAHALVWALPRTSHWTATAWENGGWEVRDRVSHLFGTGFPKSLDVAKAIQSGGGGLEAIRRMQMGDDYVPSGRGRVNYDHGGGSAMNGAPGKDVVLSEAARLWDGFGTALKPACEDWWLLRKPISEKNVAANVLRWGTGALDIDASRVHGEGGDSKGRFPAHVITDGSDEVRAAFPDAAGQLAKSRSDGSDTGNKVLGKMKNVGERAPRVESDKNASRFFYTSKPSRKERDLGLGDCGGNTHNTVKSVALLEYLIRMVTPPGGVVLDCFLGSGGTAIAAERLGHPWVGVELEAEHVEIAKKRIAAWRGKV